MNDAAAGPLPAYRARVADGRLSPDNGQRLAAERLQDLWTKLRGYDPPPRPHAPLLGRLLRRRALDETGPGYPNGLYLAGEVGRGKTMLMDLFFEQAQVPRKRRLHFHEFMAEAHARIRAWRDAHPEGDDPIPPLADGIARDAALLCFDEFQIEDIADALILGRLFQALFARGVVVVATANTVPDHLFRGRPGRDAFAPFIDILKRHLDVLMLEGARDYREAPRSILQPVWHTPADLRATAALDAAFAHLTGDQLAAPTSLTVLGRHLAIPLAAGRTARFSFAELCRTSLGPADYLALATHYEALILDRIPRLDDPDRADEARRFSTLIDTLYDHRVKLVASAETTADTLFLYGNYRRTASRLAEMQTDAYLALPHLT